jgi:hypothetical protein
MGFPSRLRGFAREILPLLDRSPGLSRGHGDTGNAETVFYRGFSAPPRLRENIRVFPTETPVLSRRRGDAEEFRAVGFSGFSVAPWLRESIRFVPDQNPDLSRRRKDAKKDSGNGIFFAPSRLCERIMPLCGETPISHGDTGNAETVSIGGSLRLRASARTSGFPPHSSRFPCRVRITSGRRTNHRPGSGWRTRRIPACPIKTPAPPFRRPPH